MCDSLGGDWDFGFEFRSRKEERKGGWRSGFPGRLWNWGLWITGLPCSVLIPPPGAQALSVCGVSSSMGTVTAIDAGCQEEEISAKPLSLSREGFNCPYGSLLRKWHHTEEKPDLGRRTGQLFSYKKEK